MIPLTHAETRATLHALVTAILETIQQAGAEGLPSGPLYMTLNCRGVSLDSYQQIMGALVQAGKVRLSNHVYYAIP